MHLSESKIRDLKQKYPQLADMIDYISKNDPSGNNKYLVWILKEWQARTDKSEESLREVIRFVRIFHALIKKNAKREGDEFDIYKLQYSKKMEYSLGDKLERLAIAHRKNPQLKAKHKKIYVDDKGNRVFHIASPGSARILGKDAHWCVAGYEDRDKWHACAAWEYITGFGMRMYILLTRESKAILCMCGKSSYQNVTDVCKEQLSHFSPYKCDKHDEHAKPMILTAQHVDLCDSDDPIRENPKLLDMINAVIKYHNQNVDKKEI